MKLHTIMFSFCVSGLSLFPLSLYAGDLSAMNRVGLGFQGLAFEDNGGVIMDANIWNKTWTGNVVKLSSQKTSLGGGYTQNLWMWTDDKKNIQAIVNGNGGFPSMAEVTDNRISGVTACDGSAEFCYSVNIKSCEWLKNKVGAKNFVELSNELSACTKAVNSFGKDFPKELFDDLKKLEGRNKARLAQIPAYAANHLAVVGKDSLWRAGIMPFERAEFDTRVAGIYKDLQYFAQSAYLCAHLWPESSAPAQTTGGAPLTFPSAFQASPANGQ